MSNLPHIAVRSTVIGVSKLLHASDRVRTECSAIRRDGLTPTLERIGQNSAHLLRSGLSTGASTYTGEADEPAEAATRTATPPPTVAEPPPPVSAEPAAPPPAPEPAGGDVSTSGHVAAEPAEERASGEEAPAPGHAEDAGHAEWQLPETTPAHDELPLSNYDELTIASLRGRLRNLAIPDLGKLLAYEREHQNRANVVKMFENRILKLEGQQES